MKHRRSLRKVFNLKGLRHVTLAFAMAMTGGCVTAERAAAQLNVQPAPVTTCLANTPPQQPKIGSDEELFRQNDDQPPSQALLQMTEDQRLQYYMKKFCFEADKAVNDNDPKDQAVVSALNTLRTVTFMGRPLVDLAAENHLKLCALKHMPAGTAAQYLPRHVFVAAGPNGQKQGQVLDLAHEITHAAQDRQGLMSYNFSWDIESRVRRNLTIEAAPVALEFAVAYEKKLGGDDSYWEYLKKHDANTAYTNPDNHRLFEKTYKDNIAAGTSQDDALHAAAHAVFERVFDSQDWRRFYLTSELNSYIEDIANGKFRQFTSIDHNQFGQEQIDKAGKIGDLPSFTKDGHIPAYADLFKGDQKMQWAYEAADLERHRQALGAGNETVQAMEAQAAANKNPYTGVDFSELNRRINVARWNGRFQTTWQLMDDLAKEKRPAPPPARPAPNCIPPQSKPAA
jgi:hypothetical protein